MVSDREFGPRNLRFLASEVAQARAVAERDEQTAKLLAYDRVGVGTFAPMLPAAGRDRLVGLHFLDITNPDIPRPLIVVFVGVHFANFPGSVRDFRRASGGGTLLDMTPEFSEEALYARLTGYGAAGRSNYAFRAVTVDVGHARDLGQSLPIRCGGSGGEERKRPRRVAVSA